MVGTFDINKRANSILQLCIYVYRLYNMSNSLTEWFSHQYRDGTKVSQVEGSKAFTKLLQGFPAQSSFNRGFELTLGRQRMSQFLRIKMRYPLQTEGYNCIAMVAEIGGVSAIYAYAFWPVGTPSGPVGVPIEYICISPTFESRDGEFRQRFISYRVFSELFVIHAGELGPIMAAAAGPQLRAREFGDSAAKTVNLPELLQKAFAIALIFDSNTSALAIHVQPNYIKVIKTVLDLQPGLVNQLTALRVVRTKFLRGSLVKDAGVHLSCGIKLIPMYARETQQPFDFNLGVWRELEITRAVSDLVINSICPSFAIYGQWTYITGVNELMFENVSMREKYLRSSEVDAAMDGLRAGRHKIKEIPLRNYYTEGLSGHMHESLEYAQSFLIMSDAAIAHLMEDVGVTLRSYGTRARCVQNTPTSAIQLFENAENGARVLFDYAYAAHCLHAHMGVAHTDLHGNNMTVMLYMMAEKLYEDPFVAYVTGPRGEADTFMFPAAGATGCLIDYSRAIVGPAFRGRIEAGRDARYATNFYRDQTNRVMRTLHRYAPVYVAAHQDAIKGAVIANFDAVFPALCAVDVIAIGASMAAALADAAAATNPGDLRPFNIDEATVKLARRLEVAGREALVAGLQRVVSASRYGGAPDGGLGASYPYSTAAIAEESRDHTGGAATPEWPGARIIAQVFADWQFTTWAAREPKRARSAQVVDLYNFNNRMAAREADYATWPAWARIDEIEKHLGELKLTDLFAGGVDGFLSTLSDRTVPLEIVAEQARAEAEKRDGPPVQAASSWIDE